MASSQMTQLFGELRSVFAQGPGAPDLYVRVFKLSCGAFELDAHTWREQWSGYIAHHARDFPVPLRVFTRFADFECASRLMPGARFELRLDYAGLDAHDARALLGALRRPSLVSLSLGGSGLTDAFVTELAHAPGVSGLEHLALNMARITDEGAIALAKSAYLNALTSLDLSRNALTYRGVEALANSANMSSLRRLDLSFNSIGPAGVRALASSACLASLTCLAIRYAELGDECVRVIASSPHLSSLTELVLQGQQIGDVGASALAASPHLSSLKHLDLSVNLVGDEGARAIASSPHLRALESLELERNPIGQAGADALSLSPGLTTTRVNVDAFMTLWREHFGPALERRANTLGWDVDELARRTGKPASIIPLIFSGRLKTGSHYHEIADALGSSLNDMFDELTSVPKQG